MLNRKHIELLYKSCPTTDKTRLKFIYSEIALGPRTARSAIQEAERCIPDRASTDQWLLFSKLLLVLNHKETPQ